MKRFFIAPVLLVLATLPGCGGSPLAPSSTGSAPAPSSSQFSDIPIPANANMNVDQSLLIGHGDNWIGRLVYTSRGSAGEIYDLYESEMPAFGWKEISSVRGSISVQNWQRGDRFATVQIRETTLGEETIVTVAPARGPGSGVDSAPAKSTPPRPPTH